MNRQTPSKMSPVARSAFIYGIYLIVVGLAYAVIPNRLLPLTDLPQTQQPWVHMFAILVGFLGCYYVVAGRYEQIPFIKATVYVRYLVIVTFALVAWADQDRWELLLFGVPNIFGATWTMLELRRQGLSLSLSS